MSAAGGLGRGLTLALEVCMGVAPRLDRPTEWARDALRLPRPLTAPLAGPAECVPETAPEAGEGAFHIHGESGSRGYSSVTRCGDAAAAPAATCGGDPCAGLEWEWLRLWLCEWEWECECELEWLWP